MLRSLKAALERVLRGANAVRIGALLLRESREDSARWMKVALAQGLASLAIAALIISVSDPSARKNASKDKEAVEVKVGGVGVHWEKDKPKEAPAPVPRAAADSEPGAVPVKRKTRASGADRAVEQAALALARRLGATVEPEVAAPPPARWSLQLGLPGEVPASVSPPLALAEGESLSDPNAPLWDLAAAVLDAAAHEDSERDEARVAEADAVEAPRTEGTTASGESVAAPVAGAQEETEPPDDDEGPAVAAAPEPGTTGKAGSTPSAAAKDEDDEEPDRFADWPLLAALARWSGAVLAAQLLVVALTRDHSEVTENALARAVGLPVPPPRPPKVRLDVRWLLRRLQRRMWTTFALIPLSIALSPLLIIVPGLGKVLLSLGAAWLVVVGTTGKDGRAWAPDLAASEPRSVSALREATRRHRALDWFLPRTLVRIQGRFVRRLQGPMNAAERAPFELAGVALTRTLALIPFVGLLLRPIVPVAVAAFVPRTSASPPVPALAATRTNAAAIPPARVSTAAPSSQR